MRIEYMIDKATREKLNKLRGKPHDQGKKIRKPKRNHQENLSDRDIENLMGVHRPRYYRDKGSYRQR